MEQLQKLGDEELNLLIGEIMGKDWRLSSLTEISNHTSIHPSYQKWDLHINEVTDGILTNHIHQRFTIYGFLFDTLEARLIMVLNTMKNRIELKRSLVNHHVYEFA